MICRTTFRKAVKRVRLSIVTDVVSKIADSTDDVVFFICPTALGIAAIARTNCNPLLVSL